MTKRRRVILTGTLAVLGVVVFGSIRFLALPGRSYVGPFHPLSASEESMRTWLIEDVRTLAVEERSMRHAEAYARAASGVEALLRAGGYTVSTEPYTVDGREVSNLVAEKRGASNVLVIVGAHYDSAEGTRGADDNASGVAVLLSLARLLRDRSFERTLRLVFFANEEPPFFKKESMGSHVYAKGCKARGEDIAAMLSLESLGYYALAKGSQKYPFPLSLLYPDTGDFVAFVANRNSKSLLDDALGTFRETTAFPSEGATLPGNMPGVSWSDHFPFWQIGAPALMVTDTAPFRNPHYHRESDTPETLDYDRLARVTSGLLEVVRRLAKDRERPLLPRGRSF